MDPGSRSLCSLGRDDGRIAHHDLNSLVYCVSWRRLARSARNVALPRSSSVAPIARSAWNCDGLDQAVVACDGAIVYPIAVGIVSATHGILLAPSQHGFLHALASNWISAGARLIPLGQTDSQRVLAALEPVVAATAARAMAATLDDLGSATFRADLASMRHETQYTRLFRS